MIPDSQTNNVYLADALRMYDAAEYESFRKFLESHGLMVKVLEWTNDIYCRDYMPVQVDENDFVQYVFKPGSYYKRSEIDLITNPVQVHIANNLQHIRYSNIILDGGNVVKWKDKVIITDKVYKDNLTQFASDEKAIHKQLEKELKCEVIVIPRHPRDKTGHADGLVRFIDERTVFINSTEGEPKRWLNYFLGALAMNRLTPVILPCTIKPKSDSAVGLYINYLHIGNLVLVPQFGPGHADEGAYEIIKGKLGKNNKIITYKANRIAKNGGVLNCVTWSVYENL